MTDAVERDASRLTFGTGVGNAETGQGDTRVFVCKQDGCTKRFTRLEHLNRHALNHTAGEATCPRCRAHFKRPDLLARHMERHRERDRETGGNGVLNTRKRCWKRLDGNIVAERPRPPRPQEVSEPIVIDPILTEPRGLISPAASHENLDPFSSNLGAEANLGHLHGQSTQEEASIDTISPSQPGPAGVFDLGWASSLSTDGLPPLQQQRVPEWDDIFPPDTAASFNMPYTTATNYNWLFDMDMHSPTDQARMACDASSSTFSPPQERFGTCYERTPQQVVLDPHPAQRPLPTPSCASRHSASDEAGALPASNMTDTASFEAPSCPGAFNVNSTWVGAHLKTPAQPQPETTNSAHEQAERPLSSLRALPCSPLLDERTRDRILTLIESLHPASPNNDQPVSREHKLLSLSSLQDYLNLFLSRFNTAYPLVHVPTFHLSKEEPLLLLAVLLLGATYSDKAAHQLAVCIHDVMRPAIFVHAGFSARPELWVLQTILLVECFGKSRAGQKQHDMSHLFHGLLINLIRRSDCQTAHPEGPDVLDASCGDVQDAWHRWAESEQKKRLALFCFLWDTQHAVLFCQSLCMSAFELRLPLPCLQSLWEARTALEWRQQGRAHVREPPQFLAALKSYLTPTSSMPPSLDATSRILVLHGLMSIAWDMERRDQTSLGMVPGEATGGLVDPWRSRLSRAYDMWKADFDQHCSNLSLRYQNQDQSPAEGFSWSTDAALRELAVFEVSYGAVFHAAQILLNTEFLDLQIYAGARHILGRPVQRSDYVRSEKVLGEWAASDSRVAGDFRAPRAAWHASNMLLGALQGLDDFDSMGLLHVPWCLYLATLTCWAFFNVRQAGGSASADHDMVWDAKAQMESLVSSMAGCRTPREMALRQGSERTAGLVWVMAGALERVRWGIVHSGVLVLRGLIPLRLIGQYDGA